MADNLRKYTTQEVLNKVYTDSSGDSIGINSSTTKETLNAVFDETDNSLNVALSGGTISGDVTISGDLTVNGDGTLAYDEIIEGTSVIRSNNGNASQTLLTLHNNDEPSGGETGQTADIEFQFQGTTNGGISFVTKNAGAIRAGKDTDYNTASADNMDSNLKFYTAQDNVNTLALTIDSNQQVGIGETIPDKKLHIKSSTSTDGIKIEQSGTGASIVTFFADGSERGFIGVDDSDGNAFLSSTNGLDYVMVMRSAQEIHFGTNGNNTAMVIDNSQNVGIGATIPDGTLHVHTATAGTVTADVWVDDLVVENSGDGGISILTPSANQGAIAFGDPDDANRAQITYQHNTDTMLINSGGSTALTIDSSQNIGIGTSSPLDGGGSKTVLTISDDTQSVLVFEDTGYESSGDGLGMFAYNDGTLTYRTASRSGTNWAGSTNRLVIDENSRISLSNNDSGGSNNTVFGYKAGNAIASGTEGNVIIGHNAGLVLNGGDANVAIGADALKAGTTGIDNTVVGTSAGDAVTSQSNLTLVGKNAGGAINDDGADGTVAVGSGSLGQLTSGSDNLAVGMNAMFKVNTGHDNVAVGKNAGFYATTAGFNTFIGKESGQGINATKLTGDHNSAIGYRSGYLLEGSAGSNTLVGSLSGDNITDGIENTIIGYGARPSSASAQNQIVIGRASTGLADNSVTLGNSSVTNVYLSTDRDARLHCGGVDLGEAVDSSDAEVLDDYEEGTFTPSIWYQNADDLTNSTNVTQTGVYTKIGNVCHFELYLKWNADDPRANDNIGINGMPFTAKNTTSLRRVFPVIVNGSSLSTDDVINGSISPNTTRIYLTGANGNEESNMGDDFGENDNMEVSISGSYIVE
jgi:hypothetical protein